MDTSGRKHLQWLQCARAIAALLVVLYHAAFRSEAISGSGGVAADYLKYGNTGVDLFFVISGFIIMHAHKGDIGNSAALPRYVYRRITRIYPLYWVVFIAVLPLYFLVPTAGQGWQTQWQSVVGGFLLLPTPPKPIIGVAWSLLLEMIFYTFFAIAIVWKRWGFALLAAWLLVCGMRAEWLFKENYPLSQFFSHYFTAFGIGMLVCSLSLKVSMNRGTALIVVGGLVFAGSFYAGVYYGADHVQRPIWLDVGFWCASGFLVAGSVAPDLSQAKSPAWLSYLGDASYSMYLTHWLAGWAIERLVLKFLGANVLPFSVSFALIASSMLLVGVLSYRWLEQPLAAFTRGRAPQFRV